jgi:hypothetical protein
MAAPRMTRPDGVPGQAGQPAQDERVAASFVLARGRMPAPAEANAWAASATSAFSELLARHAQQLDADQAARQAVALKAGVDAFGVGPDRVPDSTPAAAGTYLAKMRGHLAWLGSHPDGYALVIQRAYRLVLRREAYSPELEYWARQPVLPFALLAACIDDWARRNQPGLTVTSGPAAVNINSPYLVTVRLTPALAVEVRAAAGFERPRNPALGYHVVAPGAGRVASVGGIHFVAAGAAGRLSVEAAFDFAQAGEASTSIRRHSHTDSPPRPHR